MFESELQSLLFFLSSHLMRVSMQVTLTFTLFLMTSWTGYSIIRLVTKTERRFNCLILSKQRVNTVLLLLSEVLEHQLRSQSKDSIRAHRLQTIISHDRLSRAIEKKRQLILQERHSTIRIPFDSTLLNRYRAEERAAKATEK